MSINLSVLPTPELESTYVQSDSRRRWCLLPWLSAFVVLIVLSELTLVPIIPDLPVGTFAPDYNFQLVLQYCACAGMKFGRDVIFTFGPLGFLYSRFYFPHTYSVVLLSWLFFAGVLASSLAVTGRAIVRSAARLVLWATPLILIASFNTDVFVFCLVTACLCHYFFVAEDSLANSALAAAFSLCFAALVLVKFTFCMAIVAAILAITADQLLIRRRFPTHVVCLSFSVPVMWLVAQGSFENFFDYMLNSVRVVSAYSESMAIETARDGLAPAAFIVLALSLVLGAAAIYRAQYRKTPLFVVVAFASVFFCVFKAAFVRHDLHGQYGCFTMLFNALMLYPFYRSVCHGGLHRRLSIVVLLSAIMICWQSYPLAHSRPKSPAEEALALPLFFGDAASQSVRKLASLSACGAELDRDRFGSTMLRVRDAMPVSETGKLDVYPWESVLAVASGAKYCPRPIFQSYSAYTPALAELNAEYLVSGPQFVLFRVQSLSRRYPTIDDGLSWPYLLTNFSIRRRVGRWLLLERNHACNPLAFKLIEQKTFELGRTIEIPAAGSGRLLWMTAEIKPTLLGQCVSFLYKIYPPRVEVTTRGGRKTSFSLPTGMAQSGFFLSPLVNTTDKFERLMKGALAAGRTDEVTRIRIIDEDNTLFSGLYQSIGTMRLARFTLPDHRGQGL